MDGSKRIGGVYRPFGEPARFIHGSEPAALTVTQTFAEGLRTGGVSVVDRTQTPFGPTTSTQEMPITLTGEVRKLWTEAKFVLAAFPGYRVTLTAECHVVIHVYRAGDSKAWEKEYSRRSSDSFNLRPALDAIASEAVNRLAWLLAQTVEEVVNDLEFVQAIGRERV